MVASPRFASLGRFKRVGLIGLGVIVLLPLLIVLAGRVSHRNDVDGKTGTGSAPIYGTGVAAAPTRAAGSAASGSYPSSTAAAAAPISAPAATTAAGSAAAPSSGSRSASSTSDAVGGNVVLAPTGADQKIIRTGTIALTVKNVVGTQSEIWNLATRLGGFVITSSASGSGDDTRGEITFRVPTDNYKIAMETLRGYAEKVESEKSTAQDVSEEYVDLVARRDNLELTVRQLQGFLGQAKNVDEALKVQSQLNIVQNDLEKIKGRIGFLDNRAAFSTITASLLPVIEKKATPPPVIEPERGWSFTHSVGEAWGRSVRGLENIADGLIAIFVGGWWFFLPLIIAGIIFTRWVRTRRPLLQPIVAPAPISPPPPADASA